MRAAGALSLLALVCTMSAAAAGAIQPDRVYGNAEGCALVKLNEFNSDGYVIVTTRYLRAHESYCEFAQVIMGRYGDLLANSICSGEGEVTPAMFAISALAEDGTVTVTGSEGDFVDTLTECKGLTVEQADKVFGD